MKKLLPFLPLFLAIVLIGILFWASLAEQVPVEAPDLRRARLQNPEKALEEKWNGCKAWKEDYPNVVIDKNNVILQIEPGTIYFHCAGGASLIMRFTSAYGKQ